MLASAFLANRREAVAASMTGWGRFVLRSLRSMCNEVIARAVPTAAVSAGPRYVGNRLAAGLSCALVAALAAALAGCATPQRREVTTVGLNRDTPTATFEYLRSMVAAEQP